MTSIVDRLRNDIDTNARHVAANYIEELEARLASVTGAGGESPDSVSVEEVSSAPEQEAEEAPAAEAQQNASQATVPEV